MHQASFRCHKINKNQMGKIVLTCAKQSGGAAGGGLSAHIERQIWDAEQQKMVEFRPDSVKHPELTKQNKEYILPKGMGRSEAVERRIKEAGITRAIRANQVRALCFLFTSDKATMDEIVRQGRFDEFTKACIEYAKKKFGAKNVVSACAHFDETTAHLHITVVPIVEGPAPERADTRKQAEARNGKAKRRYKKQEVTARLCAKEIFTPENAELWQEEFPVFLKQYGFDLERGVKGSKAKHMDPATYNAIHAEIEELQQERVAAEQKLAEKKKELVTAEDELRSAKSGMWARFTQPSKYKEMLAEERKAGADEAMDVIINASNLKYKSRPTPELYGKKYRGLWDDRKRLTKELDDEKKARAQENTEHKAETKMLRGELESAKSDAKKAHDENDQWFRDYIALCNEKANLQRKLDTMDDSNLKALEQKLNDTNQKLQSTQHTLQNLDIFAKNVSTLLGIDAYPLSKAAYMITKELTGKPAQAAFALFLGYVDAATNYMESGVGGGGVQGQLTDWSGRKLNESDEDFIHRCIDTVKSITAPKQAHVANVAPTVTYRRKR